MVTSYLAAFGHFFGYAPGEALIITPGRAADMLAWANPPEKEDD